MTCQGYSCPYYKQEYIPTDRGLKPEWRCALEDTDETCPYDEGEEDEH